MAMNRIEAGVGGVQGLHFAGMGTVNGTPAAYRPKMLTSAVNVKNAGSLHVSNCFIDA